MTFQWSDILSLPIGKLRFPFGTEARREAPQPDFIDDNI
jgi:hypothetical protein